MGKRSRGGAPLLRGSGFNGEDQRLPPLREGWEPAERHSAPTAPTADSPKCHQPPPCGNGPLPLHLPSLTWGLPLAASRPAEHSGVASPHGARSSPTPASTLRGTPRPPHREGGGRKPGARSGGRAPRRQLSRNPQVRSCSLRFD